MTYTCKSIALSVMEMRWFVMGLTVCVLAFVLSGAHATELGIQVPFKTIAKGQFCKYYGEDNYVIRDPLSFKILLDKAGVVVNDKINFNREMVIAVFHGWKPTTGYDINIRSVELVGNPSAVDANGNVLVVTVVKKKPGENCYLSQVITAPYHLVKLPRFDGKVIFEEIEVIEHCHPSDGDLKETI